MTPRLSSISKAWTCKVALGLQAEASARKETGIKLAAIKECYMYFIFSSVFYKLVCISINSTHSKIKDKSLITLNYIYIYFYFQ
ncbi:hypothetical protein NC653_015118 [Populus alba x Populus x berolinensis]|uniref:Uncharacterized protein n=1 Tax=Populus alba x Populus x berolinensis TaxID=444605 RepID=A0AAD6QYQ5_9ROSI|nr:hypothetical protein NC653_015111 [Populus alba x Populus x berolinensis]KAJ6999180.1 hypothetical protein NC653_015118 [Populus alba x Populus x berolinensis]